jgi:hypothetical protein
MSDLKAGKYQHYKGKMYEVLGVAHHSETLEELVVYKALYETRFGRDSLWVRPKAMFIENVSVDGREIPRFKFIGSA